MALQDLKRLTKELKALNLQLQGFKTKPQRQRIQRRAFQIIGQIERGQYDR